MASFLFRKQKQDLSSNGGQVVVNSPTTLQSSAPPLYSRFATTAEVDYGGAGSTARVVSSPMTLRSHSRSHREERTGNGVAGKYGYSSNSLTSSIRDVDKKKTKELEQQMTGQLRERSLNGGLAFPRVVSQLMLDKPLPPPVPPAEEKPPSVRTAASNRVAPPSSLSTQQMMGRMSLDVQARENKPLPRPESSQGFYSASALSSTPATRSVPPPSPASAYGEHPLKVQQQQPQSSALSYSPALEAQTLSISPSKQQDLNQTRNGSSNTLPTTPPSSAAVAMPETLSFQNASQRTPSSEKALDLPEFAIVQGTDENSRAPCQTHSSQPSNESGNSSYRRPTEEQELPLSDKLPSNNGGEYGTGSYLPPTSLTKVPHRSRRTLPTAPQGELSNDGSTSPRPPISPSPQDLYPSHIFSSTTSQHNARATDRLPIMLDQSSVSPHLSQSMRPQPVSSSYQAQATPSRAQLLYSLPEQRDQQMLRTEPSLVSPESKSIQESLRKSPNIQNGVTSMSKGKPRIFAAMEALESQENKQPEPFINDAPYTPPGIQNFPTQGSQLMRTAPMEELTTPQLQYEPPALLFPSGSEQVKNQSASPNGLKPIPSQFPISAQERIPAQVHSRRLSNTRLTGRQDELLRPSVPQTPPRTKKLSKARHPSDVTAQSYHMNGFVGTSPGTPDGGQNKLQLGVSKNNTVRPGNDSEPVVHLDEETIRKAGIPLDDDPFARVEGVRMMKPSSSPNVQSKSKEKGDIADGVQSATPPQRENGWSTQPNSDSSHPSRKDKRGKDKSPFFQLDSAFTTRMPHEPVTATRLLFDPQVFSCILQFLSFYEWCNLLALSKEIRLKIVRTPALREAALERFLKTIGYSHWTWDDQEPLSLSLQDLSDYMRGVSTPTHEYARAAVSYIQSLRIHPNHRDPLLGETVYRLAASTRAYNRVLLRLRAQAEKEASIQSAPPTSFASGGKNFTPTTHGGNTSRTSSRAPSPATLYSNLSGNGYLPGAMMQASNSQTSLASKSPLFRLRRAPLLRVFVPSPEGDWLSDRSVLECEAEVKRAGIQHLLRMGDVVWDVAVGDEGNSGKLVWNGGYLIDLDFTYSAVGDLPKYLPALAFPPSYFHRVIRTSHSNSNPIVHIDISPWGQEIAMNLQLLQDRARTETPQGAQHTVMRWVHRSSFQLRPTRTQQMTTYPAKGPINRIPIPNSGSLFVDPGWYGTIVVETEGTNEALADLQDRCGPGVFPSRPQGYVKPTQLQMDNRKVFRILRERSRPGEIWIHAVGMKERIL